MHFYPLLHLLLRRLDTLDNSEVLRSYHTAVAIYLLWTPIGLSNREKITNIERQTKRTDL